MGRAGARRQEALRVPDPGGAQAGLSWSTILHKRENYRKAFARFDPRKVAKFTRKDVARLMKDAGIVRNRLKIESSISNAKVFLEVKKEFGSFDEYIWSFVAADRCSTAGAPAPMYRLAPRSPTR